MKHKIDFQKIIIIFILLQPFFDMLTSISAQSSSLSLGIITKGLLLVIGSIYMLFYKKDKKFLIYGMCVFAYFIIFSLINYHSDTFISEISYFIKSFYFPIILLFFCDLFKNKENSKLLGILALIISTSLLIAVLSGTSFLSYESGSKFGFSGWFYSANELSGMLSILFPIVLVNFITKFSKFNLLNLIITLVSMLLIGTKTTYLAILLTLLSFICYEIFCKICKKNGGKRKYLLSTITILIIILSITPITPSYKNTKSHIGNATVVDEEVGEDVYQINIDNVIYYGREGYLKFVQEEYNKAPWQNKIFGLGRNVHTDDSQYTVYLIERDFHDLFFCYGPVGMILILIIPIIILFKILKKVFLSINFDNFVNIALGVSILLGLAIAFMSGHVLLYPAVSTYLAVVISSLYSNIYSKK